MGARSRGESRTPYPMHEAGPKRGSVGLCSYIRGMAILPNGKYGQINISYFFFERNKRLKLTGE